MITLSYICTVPEVYTGLSGKDGNAFTTAFLDASNAPNYVHKNIYTYVRMHTYTTHTLTQFLCTKKQYTTCIPADAHTQMCAHTHTDVHAHTDVCTQTCVHMHTDVHAHIHTHT